MISQSIVEPIFIVGAHRSGSTLLRVMLDHHPKISLPHEFEFTMHLVKENGESPELEKLYQHLSLNDSFSRSGFQIDRSLSFEELINSFLEQRRDGKPVIGMTCHENFDRLRFFWPKAKYIHILRDPRDVANSVVQMGWAGNVWVAVNRWIQAERTWNLLCENIAEEQRIEVRFEDLMGNPEAELSKVCDFLKLTFDEQMLSYSSNSDYSSPNASAVSRWRSKMPAKDIQLIEARVGELCRDRNYDLSELPKLSIGPFKQFWLKLHNHLTRSWSRLQRHPGITIKLFIAQRLGQTKRVKQIVQQKHEIYNRQVKRTRYSN